MRTLSLFTILSLAFTTAALAQSTAPRKELRFLGFAGVPERFSEWVVGWSRAAAASARCRRELSWVALTLRSLKGHVFVT